MSQAQAQAQATCEALAVAAAAIGALPSDHAIVIFLGASGSSTKHLAQVLQRPQADVELLRSHVTKVFVKYAREYELKHPDISGLTPVRAARAYWNANVTVDAVDPRHVRLKAAAFSAFE